MTHNRTIFRQMLQLFSRYEFQTCVDRYNGDHRARTLRCWDQFTHIIFGQLSKRDSLRDTVDMMNTQQKKLYHIGTNAIKRSTFSDANNTRDYRIYRDLFFNLLSRVQRIAPKYKLKLNSNFYILDSTTIDLSLTLFPWARFRKTKAAVKLHTLMNADGFLPEFIRITDGKVHDSTAAKQIHIPEGSYLAIDRAYHDFRQYNLYNNRNIRFVTRKKTDAKYRILNEQDVVKNSGVLSDQIIEFTGYQTHKKYPHPLRLIRFRDQKNDKELEFLTNDLELDALTIAKIYKARWEIELFFKTIKQNLKIKRFIGNSPNAVWTQVWIALIAYLLVSYLKFVHKSKHTVQKLFHRIQLNLFEIKPLAEILYDLRIRPPNKVKVAQVSLFGGLTGH